MGQSADLDRICDLLSNRYADRGGAIAAQRLKHWVSGNVPLAYPEILEKHLDEAYLSLLFDAFWQVLPFGTGGRRGPVGYGPNRVNPSTIVLTVQGHCDYLRSALGSGEISVVVANDVRLFKDIRGTYTFLGTDHPLIGWSSRKFAKLAAEVYAANGIICYLDEPESDAAVLTTPELSFMIWELKTAGGINVSASHNPPDDNGIKVYDQYGSQPIAPNDQNLIDTMELVKEVRRIPFAEALSKQLVRGISEKHHRTYVDTYVKLFGKPERTAKRYPIVFTPLCGCGMTTVGRVMPALNFELKVPPDELADGSFGPIPFKAPNPEVAEATRPAKEFAMQQGSEIVLSSDPDADRIGVEARLADGSWYHFDGNQIAAMLCYYLMLDPKGPQHRGLVIETLVTTKILGRIVEIAGQNSWIVDDLLVGFKYVADVIKEIEQTHAFRGRKCDVSEFVLAAEESHGVVMVPTIRDKDALGGCMYIGLLYERLKDEGKTLLDYYTGILEEVGEFAEVSRSIVMAGAEGVYLQRRLMESLRQSPPTSFNKQPIRETRDYWDEKVHGKFVSESDKLPRNVIHYTMDTFTITVRPSGTEPKLKIYGQLLPSKSPSSARGVALMKEAKEKAEAMVREVYHELLHRIDINAGPISLLLPDIIDIARKQAFETDIVPELIREVNANRFKNSAEVLDWLRSRVKTMLPGADILPALKSTITFLCKDSFKGCSEPVVTGLQEWANS